MQCPFCEEKGLRVVDKRNIEGAIRRRRECLSCKKRFTTYEKHEPHELFVVKKSGNREAFNREKIFVGILKACEKRSVDEKIIQQAVEEIESVLMGRREIESKIIGEMVLKRLKKIDKVAYMRFASVFKGFKDLKYFEKELKALSN